MIQFGIITACSLLISASGSYAEDIFSDNFSTDSPPPIILQDTSSEQPFSEDSSQPELVSETIDALADNSGALETENDRDLQARKGTCLVYSRQASSPTVAQMWFKNTALGVAGTTRENIRSGECKGLASAGFCYIWQGDDSMHFRNGCPK